MITLGPRALKTGIAVTISLFICIYFELEPAVFAGVAAIFTIQPSIYKTWRQMLDQIITNTIGAIIALFALSFIGNNPVIIGLILIIVILVCVKFKMEANVISLTMVTVLAIMSAPGDKDWLFALNRFNIIMIGMLSGFAVNLLILPPKFKVNYYEKSKEAFNKLSLLLRTAISDELTEKTFSDNWKNLQKDIQKLEEQYKMFDEERAKMSKVNRLNVREIVVFKQMLKALKQGEKVLELIEEHYFQSDANENEDKQFDTYLEQLIKSHEYYLLKYEGKIKADDTVKSHEQELKGFLSTLLNGEETDSDHKLRMLAVGFAVYEYAFQLKRLNQLIEQYLKKESVK
ncbi:FUSC family protein [Litchfieldia alkalitelluris]|uniref:FUSC family protein n=1 Tax=Litchfieldia alkalitelluris TaxID=304268 RepID=UPI001F347B98|nr:aromatic acid exporter family protein [Litchfieldia alkalitelluris]